MSETWTYYDANTIQIAGDSSAYYWPNMLLKITQSTEKFFVVLAVAVVGGNTRLTISGGGVYTLTNAAITVHAATKNAGEQGIPIGFLEQGLAYGAATKSTPADADGISLWDSVALFGRKNLTWANLKATLKIYFDGLYAVIGHNHSGTYAAAANGVTNGDNHDHAGGDGARIDHGGLGGLSDDDHARYALLAGRAGGQTFEGDTASGGNLTLKSTHHATKGSILFGTSAYDEVNNRLGLGMSNPGKTLDVNGGVCLRNAYPFEAISTAFMYFPHCSRHVAYYKKTGGYSFYWRSSDTGYPGGANEKTLMEINADGNFWVFGNCSALSFTDRTYAFTGNALAAIEKIAADADGNIDHSTLPEFAINPYQDERGEWWPGRDIGNMVSVLTKGMQQLIAENTALKERLKKLEGE